ncbi:MAG: cyclase family protein [Eubacteriales bacterium]|nr:cyclase family protein [Eubacteriales bacterium]MDY3332523.1 cyclase family protein [Gallibacter sp.]
MNNKLWELCKELKNDCEFVELSHEVSPDTPHWSGFEDMENATLFDYPDGFYVNRFSIVSQYGTHVDAPGHFVKGNRMLNEIEAKELILPLCVVDVSDKVAKNVDYCVTSADIIEWEEKYGKVPEESFVALRTDWYKRGHDLDNCDANGMKHFPGWTVDAIEYLVKKRNVTAIGHETSDTDPPVITEKEGYVGETYILAQQRYQIELLKNLDKVPPVGALIVSGFPRVVDGSGFTARCYAICPK